MSDRAKVLIFAGTHQQAVGWRMDNGYSQGEAEYVHDARALRGRVTQGMPRVFVGTFWQRADADELQQALLVTDLPERRRP